MLPMRGAVACLLVASCVRGAQPASRLRVPPCNYTDPSTGPTRKTAYSRDRLIDVAGLEHTGHHQCPGKPGISGLFWRLRGLTGRHIVDDSCLLMQF